MVFQKWVIGIAGRPLSGMVVWKVDNAIADCSQQQRAQPALQDTHMSAVRSLAACVGLRNQSSARCLMSGRDKAFDAARPKVCRVRCLTSPSLASSASCFQGRLMPSTLR